MMLLGYGCFKNHPGPQSTFFGRFFGFVNNSGYEAHKLFSEEVRTALFHRLEGGQEIPFRAESLLQTVGVTVDEGPLAELVMQPNSPKKVAGAAISIVGPKTIAKLIDQLLAVDRQLRASTGRVDDATRDEHYRLVSWISRTHLSSFTEAILTRSDIYEPCEIALLAELLARHGEVDDRSRLPIDDPLYTRMVDTVGHWVEILLASPEATRHQFAEVAQAIERLPEPQLVSGLQRLLAADLARWQRARDEAAIARAQRKPPHPDAYHSWTLQYSRAFAAIGDSQTVELMKAYLPAMDFGVVDDLVKPEAGVNAHRHALQLAKIAFSLPSGNRTDTIDTLLQLPMPLT